MNDVEFRQKISELFKKIENRLEKVDPDQVECNLNQGALVLSFSDRSNCILSAQPSVQQLWMAVASRGVAHHFNFDLNTGKWKDDKNLGIEPLKYLADLIQAQAQLAIQFD